MYKKILGTLVIIIGVALIIASYIFPSQNRDIVRNELSELPQNTSTTTTPSTTSVQKSAKVKPQSAEKLIPITFVFKNASYSVNVKEYTTGYEAMQKLASTTAFTFKATYNSGLGYFIDEINGVPNTSRTFWIYYVNGKEATVGISMYIMKPGDSINWRYENSNKQEVAF